LKTLTYKLSKENFVGTNRFLLMNNSDKYENTTKGREAHACNSVYVAIAGEMVNQRSVLLRNFLLNEQESASNPLLHIHANRYKPHPPFPHSFPVFDRIL